MREGLPLPAGRGPWHVLATVLARAARQEARSKDSETTAVCGRRARGDVPAGIGTPAEASRTKQVGVELGQGGYGACPGRAEDCERADNRHSSLDRPQADPSRANVGGATKAFLEGACPGNQRDSSAPVRNRCVGLLPRGRPPPGPPGASQGILQLAARSIGTAAIGLGKRILRRLIVGVSSNEVTDPAARLVGSPARCARSGHAQYDGAAPVCEQRISLWAFLS